ncbi:MAG: hypothetical protein ACFCUT_00660 [Kiloniellaceae bacterium]
MNDSSSTETEQGGRGLASWLRGLAAGDWRATSLLFVLLTGFYLATAAGNLSETDDVYAFAYRAEHFALDHLSDPRLMLYHIAMRLLFLGASALEPDVSALILMRVISALAAAASLLLVVRIAVADLKVSIPSALLAAAVLGSCYGFWRYAAEAEVYLPAIFLILLIFRGLSSGIGDGGEVRRRARMLTAAAWGGLAGLVVLFYQPSVIPLFFAFPLLLLYRGRIVPLGCYLAVGIGVVLAGYVIGFLAYWPQPLGVAAFNSFLSQRSEEFMVPSLSLRTVVVSMIRAAFALGHDIVSANWIFAFDPVAGLIQRAFSNNVITEEVFLAKRAGLLAYLPVLSLPLLAVLSLRILVAIWPLQMGLLRQRQFLTLLLWVGINGAIVGRLNPAGVEAWIMLLPPLVLAMTACAIEPCLRTNRGHLVGAFAAALFLHNAVGGMALVFDPENEYDRVKGAWIIAEAGPRDLVVVTENAGLVESLRYLSSANVALIATREAPAVADSLLRGDMNRLFTLTSGRDFNNRLLRNLIKETWRQGGRLIVFDDFFKLPVQFGNGGQSASAALGELREQAVRVYDAADVGATYVLTAAPR